MSHRSWHLLGLERQGTNLAIGPPVARSDRQVRREISTTSLPR